MSSRINLPRKVSTAALPHYSGAITSSRAIWTLTVLLSLLLIWGTLLFGPKSLLIAGLSLVSAVIAEGLALLLIHPPGTFLERFRQHMADGSSVLTAMLIALSLPVTVHPMVPVIAVLFAVLVVKWSFGGLGAYWVHPALAGRLFVTLSWPAGFAGGDWGRTLLKGLDWNTVPLTGISDLAAIKQHLLSSGSPHIFRPLQLLAGHFSAADSFLTRMLNDQILRPSGTILPNGYMDYIFGFRLGAIGETSILLILIISVFLFARGIISWEIPLGGIVSMAGLSFVLSGTSWGAAAFNGDALFALTSGACMFVLFFMATDPVTSPYTSGGKLIYGLGFGALAFLFREYSILPDGSVVALLLMNILNPFIILISRPRPFGLPRSGAAGTGSRVSGGGIDE